MKYVESFKADVSEIAIIEDALNYKLTSCLEELGSRPERNRVATLKTRVENIHKLLGSLHNQKNWFRPKCSVYISG